MRVAGCDNGDAGVEIQETITIHILDNGAFTAGHDKRIAASIGRRHDFRVAFDDAPGIRARKRRDQIRQETINTGLALT